MNLDDLLKSIREEDDDSKGGKINADKFKTKSFKNPLVGQRFKAPGLPTERPVVIKVEPSKLIPKDEGVSKELIESINELVAVIKADNELEKDLQDYTKEQEEKEKREKREARIEGVKKFLGSAGKRVVKAIKPITNFFENLKRFLFFGTLSALIEPLYKFFTNPENKGKIEATGKFLKDWWPALAVAAGLALTPLKGLIAIIGGVAIKGLLAVSKLLLANPLVAAAVLLGVGGVVAYLKLGSTPSPDADRAAKGITLLEDNIEFGGGAPGMPLTKEMLGFNGGGMNMGTDTVPAMLSPGEFVMSRGAVNMFGADTMMAMNKAGGGTNIPKYGLVSGYSGGGFVEKMGITRSQFEIYKREVAKIESEGSGGYSARGGANNHYDGKYQMGKVAKMDAARLLGETFPGHDAAARAAFRADPAMQERYFEAYTKANHGYMMSDPMFANASPQRKLEILGYAHNQGWSKALDWLNTGEVGRDKFGTKGTKYVDAINEAFKNKTSTPTAPPVIPPPGFDSNKGDTRFGGFDLDFIFKPIREFLGVDTPNAPTSNRVIVLPTIKADARRTKVSNQSTDIPEFSVTSNVRMRGLVGKALGIEDLVS